MIVTNYSEQLSERSKKILRLLSGGEALSRSTIEEKTGESRISTIRELGELCDKGLVKKSGETRAIVYTITDSAQALILWDVEDYLAQEPDKREVRHKSIEPTLFEKFDGAIGFPMKLTESVKQRRHIGDGITARREFERFVIELSWKSSKIEGNTYTLLDTERLLEEAEEAPGHNHAEAVMILNHKKTFEYIWEHQKSFKHLTVSKIEEVHQLLVTGLQVPFGLRDSPVGITGTAYVPPASKIELTGYLRDIVELVNRLENPLEKTLACLVLIPYLQPFADGNKRTSRLLANAVLLAHGYPPLSYRSIDEQEYKGALILFYEQGVLANLRELFIYQLTESALNYYFPIGEDGRKRQI